MDLFEAASRMKLRFDTPTGSVSAEDLWDLPLTSKNKANLDDIARAADAALKQVGETRSFVEQSKPKDVAAQLRFDIVLRVIAVKQEENKAKVAAAERAAEKQKLLEIIDRKQDEQLSSASLDELRARLNALS